METLELDGEVKSCIQSLRLRHKDAAVDKIAGFYAGCKTGQAFPPPDLGYFIASRLRPCWNESLIQKRGETSTRTFRDDIMGRRLCNGTRLEFLDVSFYDSASSSHRRRCQKKKEDVDVFENMPAHSGDIKDATSHDDAAIVLISDHACTRRGKSADNGVLLLHVCCVCRDAIRACPRIYGAHFTAKAAQSLRVCGRGLFIIHLNYYCYSNIRVMYTVL